jgi:hypothetical protein
MTDKKKLPIYLIDTSAEFYRPLATRIAICLASGLWAAMEIWHREGFWGVIAGAVAIYCVYVLFLTYTPPSKPEPAVRMEESEQDADGHKSSEDNS